MSRYLGQATPLPNPPQRDSGFMSIPLPTFFTPLAPMCFPLRFAFRETRTPRVAKPLACVLRPFSRPVSPWTLVQ